MHAAPRWQRELLALRAKRHCMLCMAAADMWVASGAGSMAVLPCPLQAEEIYANTPLAAWLRRAGAPELSEPQWGEL